MVDLASDDEPKNNQVAESKLVAVPVCKEEPVVEARGPSYAMAPPNFCKWLIFLYIYIHTRVHMRLCILFQNNFGGNCYTIFFWKVINRITDLLFVI